MAQSNQYIGTTTTNLNVRSGPGTNYRRLTTLSKGTDVEIVSFTDNSWVEIKYKNGYNAVGNGYVSSKYLRTRAVATNNIKSDDQNTKRSSSGFNLWSVLWWIIKAYLCLIVLYWVLRIFKIGLIIALAVFEKVFRVLCLPFSLLNALQRILAKPWFLFFKLNHFNSSTNENLRNVFSLLKIPLYLALTPLRLANAIFYNLIIHCLFEMFNYIIEVIFPSSAEEGAYDRTKWCLWLPVRILKYPIWHGTLTIVESIIWTAVDTILPTLTVYHGTSPEAADAIVGSPERGGRYCGCNVGLWNVGAGNYAGDGIYFAPARSTALHYACGSLIVCRVTFGKTLDLGLAPYHIFSQCGKPNAHGVTKYGLDNGYVTGEWWRKKTGYNGDWWEYCMYDWQNRYNFSWRIRPLYVIDLKSNYIQRIPGGMAHWLFRSMVFEDIFRGW